MLGRATQGTRELRRCPYGFNRSVLSQALLYPHKPLSMAVLSDLQLLHLHLDIVKVVPGGGEAGIHSQPARELDFGLVFEARRNESNSRSKATVGHEADVASCQAPNRWGEHPMTGWLDTCAKPAIPATRL